MPQAAAPAHGHVLHCSPRSFTVTLCKWEGEYDGEFGIHRAVALFGPELVKEPGPAGFVMLVLAPHFGGTEYKELR